MSDVKLTDFDGKNRHVDLAIQTAQFMDAAKCLVYAASPDSTSDLSTMEFKPIGVVQGFSFSEQRDLARIFELGSDIPYLVPGRTVGNISINRLLLYGKDLVNTLYNKNANTSGNNYIASLKDIGVPLCLMFVAKGNTAGVPAKPAVPAVGTTPAVPAVPAVAASTPMYSRVFSDCWITSRQENISSGQSIISEGVSIAYSSISAVNIVSA